MATIDASSRRSRLRTSPSSANAQCSTACRSAARGPSLACELERLQVGRRAARRSFAQCRDPSWSASPSPIKRQARCAPAEQGRPRRPPSRCAGTTGSTSDVEERGAAHLGEQSGADTGVARREAVGLEQQHAAHEVRRRAARRCRRRGCGSRFSCSLRGPGRPGSRRLAKAPKPVVDAVGDSCRPRRPRARRPRPRPACAHRARPWQARAASRCASKSRSAASVSRDPSISSTDLLVVTVGHARYPRLTSTALRRAASRL
jgi:hypothetical protein